MGKNEEFVIDVGKLVRIDYPKIIADKVGIKSFKGYITSVDYGFDVDDLDCEFIGYYTFKNGNYSKILELYTAVNLQDMFNESAILKNAFNNAPISWLSRTRISNDRDKELKMQYQKYLNNKRK